MIETLYRIWKAEYGLDEIATMKTLEFVYLVDIVSVKYACFNLFSITNYSLIYACMYAFIHTKF